MLLLEKIWYKLVTSLTGLVAAFFGLAAVMSIVEQANKWSMTGVWTTVTIADLLMAWGLTRPETPNYIGLQKIIDEVLTWPGIESAVMPMPVSVTASVIQSRLFSCP